MERDMGNTEVGAQRDTEKRDMEKRIQKGVARDLDTKELVGNVGRSATKQTSAGKHQRARVRAPAVTKGLAKQDRKEKAKGGSATHAPCTATSLTHVPTRPSIW